MCLIAWNWQPNASYPLVLVGNRDEFYARPTQSLHWWEPTGSGDRILAGRDLTAGGTWLGLSASGRLAALTNVRAPELLRKDTPSRGELVAGFLQTTTSAQDYLRQLQGRAMHYNPFNLLVFDGHELMGFESRSASVLALLPGVGAVSNAAFETPWPKLVQLRQGLQTHVQDERLKTDELLKLLHSQTIAPDAELPNTGISLEMERLLSAPFIVGKAYGTRASSVVKMSTERTEFTEVTFGAEGLQLSRNEQVFEPV